MAEKSRNITWYCVIIVTFAIQLFGCHCCTMTCQHVVILPLFGKNEDDRYKKILIKMKLCFGHWWHDVKMTWPKTTTCCHDMSLLWWHCHKKCCVCLFCDTFKGTKILLGDLILKNQQKISQNNLYKVILWCTQSCH